MAQKQDPKKALLCTYKECKKLQDGEGEFCPKHYPKEHTYYFDVTVKWSNVMHGYNKADALNKLKASYEEEYGLYLTNKEIKYTGKEDK